MNSTKANPHRHRGARGEPTFLTKSQLAYAMGRVLPATIDDWIAAGTVPPPHSRPGAKCALWLKTHFDVYVQTGRWPDAAFTNRKGTP